MSKIHKGLDWLTVSVTQTAPLPKQWLPDIEGLQLEEVKSATSPYDVQYITTSGAQVLVSNDVRQGMCLNVTGSTLQKLRDYTTDIDLLTWAVSNDNRVTRLDFAADMVESPISIKTATQAILEGMAVTRTKKFKEFADLNGDGYTLYIGSRHSKQRMRIYDKAAEMKLLEEAWTRAELQARKEKAHALASQMVRETNVADVGSQACRNFIDFPTLEWYQELMTTQANISIDELPRREPAFWKWCEEQIIPACRKRLNTEEREYVILLSEVLTKLLGT